MRLQNRPRKIILLSLDSLRYDRLGFSGHKPSPSPTIDCLLSSGLCLTNSFVTGCPTQFSMPALHTSTLPLDKGGYNLGIGNRGRTLAEVFRAAGYQTAAFVSGLALAKLYGYDRGFDDYFSFFDLQFFPKGFRNLYLRSVREGYKAKRISFQNCVEILVPPLSRILEGLADFCGEKQQEIDKGTVILSPVIHSWDFGRILDCTRLAQKNLSEQPAAYVQQMLARNERESPFDFIPYGREGVESRTNGQVVIGEQSFSQGGYGASGVSGNYIVQNALRWIEAHGDSNFFAWVHLIDVHDRCFTSFDAPAAEEMIREEVSGHSELYEKIAEMQCEYVGSPSYDFSVRYVDEQVRRVVDFLRERNLTDETLLVLTSDHGHLSANWPIRKKIDIVDFFSELYHVPTVFVHPEINSQRVEGLCSSLDIAPTLLDLAGLEIPPEFRGVSIADTAWKERDHVLMEHLGRGPCDFQFKAIHVCVRTKHQKVVCVAPPPLEGKPLSVLELYDLSKDPHELNNLKGDKTATAKFSPS